MAYDEDLAERVGTALKDQDIVDSKKMFGGLCFLVHGNMCCGIVDDRLMLRVGPDQYEDILKKEHVLKMDFTGRPMRGMVYVEPEGLQAQPNINEWIEYALDFVLTLPPK